MASVFELDGRSCKVAWGDIAIMQGDQAVVYDVRARRLVLRDIHANGYGETFDLPRDAFIYGDGGLYAIILGRVLN